MKFKVEATQINYGWFEFEADSKEEAELMLAEQIEDDFIRDYSDWQHGEIEVVEEQFAYVGDGAYCADCAEEDYEKVLIADGYPDGYTCAGCGTEIK